MLWRALGGRMGCTHHSCRTYRKQMTRIIVSRIALSYFACNTLKRLAIMRVSRSMRITHVLEEGRSVRSVDPRT
jgi:hypothetical protein